MRSLCFFSHLEITQRLTIPYTHVFRRTHCPDCYTRSSCESVWVVQWSSARLLPTRMVQNPSQDGSFVSVSSWTLDPPNPKGYMASLAGKVKDFLCVMLSYLCTTLYKGYIREINISNTSY